MLLAAVDPLAAFASVTGAVAGIIASVALLQGRRTEDKTATREEVGQAFELQDKQMQRIVEENERLRARDKAMHDTVNSVVGELGQVKAAHMKCEKDLNALGDRLRLAEARITELGG